MSAEAKLRELGIDLPEPPAPIGKYVQAVQVGELLHIAGHGPVRGAPNVIGKVGADLSVEQGAAAARQTGLNTLAINAAPDFAAHALVIDGYTDLMISIFGDGALCAWSAPGMGSAPFQVAIIADAIVQAR